MPQSGYQLPLGSVVARLSTPGLSDGRLKTVVTNFLFAEAGREYTIELDERPIVMASANREMILAHTADVRVIDEIINAFKERGVCVRDIVMCIQFVDALHETKFLDRAHGSGLVHFWMTPQINKSGTCVIKRVS